VQISKIVAFFHLDGNYDFSLGGMFLDVG